MIINNPNAPFIPPFNPFIVPSSFYDSWSQEEQIVYLAENKQGRLIPGTGVYIVDNGDGTYTISSDGGSGEGHTYEVRAVAHPSEGNVAEYKLIDLLTGEQSGVTITVPDVNGIASIVTQQSASKAIVTINMTNGTSKSFDVYYGQDGQDGVSPSITVTDITGGHRIVIVSASGTETFNVMDGTPGTPGATGATPNISVSGSVHPMGSSALPVVTVTKTGTPENPNFDFQFANLKGAPGPVGPAPNITVTDITGGHRVVIVSGSGTETFDVMDGSDGDDGYSPTVIVTPIAGGHHVAISTVEGTEEFDVMDGAPGAAGATPNITVSGSVLPIGSSALPVVTVTKTGTPANPNFDFLFANLKGAPGPEGLSPTVTVRDITGGHQIEIVSIGGVERFDVMDGTDGSDGADGVSPTITVRDITGGHQIEIVSAGGVERFDVMDGTTPNITITASVLSISGSVQPMSPSVTVTKTGTDERPNFDFEFEGLGGGGSLPSGGNKGNVLTLKDPSTNVAEWDESFPILQDESDKVKVIKSRDVSHFITPNTFVISNFSVDSLNDIIQLTITNNSNEPATIGYCEIRYALLIPIDDEQPVEFSGAGDYSMTASTGGDNIYTLYISDSNAFTANEERDYQFSVYNSNIIDNDFGNFMYLHTLPTGGDQGDVLTKASNSNYHVQWAPAPGGIPTSSAQDLNMPLISGGASSNPSWARSSNVEFINENDPTDFSALELTGLSIDYNETNYIIFSANIPACYYYQGNINTVMLNVQNLYSDYAVKEIKGEVKRVSLFNSLINSFANGQEFISTNGTLDGLTFLSGSSSNNINVSCTGGSFVANSKLKLIIKDVIPTSTYTDPTTGQKSMTQGSIIFEITDCQLKLASPVAEIKLYSNIVSVPFSYIGNGKCIINDTTYAAQTKFTS